VTSTCAHRLSRPRANARSPGRREPSLFALKSNGPPFLLREGSTTWALAPAYDITFAHNPQGEWTNQHLMSVNGRFKGHTVADLLAEADRYKIGTAKRVIEQVRNALRRWPQFAEAAGLPEAEMADRQRQLLLLD
jgi:serine/threonine-protein kinase HipA